MGKVRLDNAAAVFITQDVRRTAAYYRDVLGFRVVEHYDAEEPLAAPVLLGCGRRPLLIVANQSRSLTTG